MDTSTTFKQLRLAKGLTLSQAAQSLNTTLQTVGRWERGGGVPSPAMYPKIASLLGIEPLQAVQLFEQPAEAMAR